MPAPGERVQADACARACVVCMCVCAVSCACMRVFAGHVHVCAYVCMFV